jgi:hypothetical protein
MVSGRMGWNVCLELNRRCGDVTAASSAPRLQASSETVESRDPEGRSGHGDIELNLN